MEASLSSDPTHDKSQLSHNQYHIRHALPFSTISIVVISDDIFMVCLMSISPGLENCRRLHLPGAHHLVCCQRSWIVFNITFSALCEYIFPFTPSPLTGSWEVQYSISVIKTVEDNPSIILRTCLYSSSRPLCGQINKYICKIIYYTQCNGTTQQSPIRALNIFSHVLMWNAHVLE